MSGYPRYNAQGQMTVDHLGQPQIVLSPGFPHVTGQPGQQNPGATFQPAPNVPFGFPAGVPNVVTPQPPNIQWIPTTPQFAQSLSERAVVAGYEARDGSPLWVIRARLNADLIPGKLAVQQRVAYVAFGGKENSVQNIEVCCIPGNRINWQESRDGAVPPNAVVGGHTATGEPLYVGRAREQGSLTPGKVHPSHKAMYISFGGKEIPHKTYEVLCTI